MGNLSSEAAIAGALVSGLAAVVLASRIGFPLALAVAAVVSLILADAW